MAEMQSPAINMPMGPEAPKMEEERRGPSAAQFIAEVNIAEHLDEEELAKIGNEVHTGYLTDMASRKEWELNLDMWTKMALQVREEKQFPWPKASNVKYPLLSTAAMQFSARSYPTLIPSNGQVVKAKVIGMDQQGTKSQRAERVGKHMSYQIMHKMPNWEDDMDKLLIILPIVGTCFKKSYWDGVEKEIVSKLVLPKDLVVNYWASSLEKAERKTERMQMSQREVMERVNSKIWLEVDLQSPEENTQQTVDRDRTENLRPAQADETLPYMILEQHRYLDLDDDGYPEPYIVTIEESSKKVLRISARFDTEGVTLDEKGNIVKITPIEYFTKYGFIPNPDGGFYDLGFGLLLGTLNESVNTIINQLIDAGTLSNLQSGFIAKGLRIKMGESRFTPGEWKSVNATSDDLHKQIVPLPVREPSNVLFQLLGTLVTSAKELASVAEIFVGKMPGQNTPATTTMATIEQGMKVFTAIYKRVYRSLDKEFKKLYRLNGIYFDPQEEVAILDTQVTQEDYEDDSYDICPAADPAAVSQTEKIAKFEAAMQLFQLGTLDAQAITARGLEAFEIPNPQELMAKGPPPPDPKQVEMQAKMQLEEKKAAVKAQSEAQKMQMEQASAQLKMQMDAQMKSQEMEFKRVMAALDQQLKMLELRGKEAETAQDLRAKALKHTQDISHKAEMNKQKAKEPKKGD